MKFKRYQKGLITQGFHEDHTGIDWVIGYGNSVFFDNPGFIYKTYHPQTRDNNWTAVYQLVSTDYEGADFMEVCMGHFMGISRKVKVGEWVKEDQLAGWEGNFGKVRSGGVPITPEMQDAGDTRGHHTHEHYRPVKLVSKTTAGKHYLNDEHGRRALYEGQFLEILHTNNTKGCIDPRQFKVSKAGDNLMKLVAKMEAGEKKGNPNLVRKIIPFVNAWSR